MGTPRPPEPVLLVAAVFSRRPAALDWARARLELSWGPIGPTSPILDFGQTRYYEPTMGTALRKQFLAFHDLVGAEALAELKARANDFEAELAASGTFAEARPLNVDPGILSLGKFQLATTKDQAHRVYLGRGIYAESTLRYRDGAFEPWPWTYADYRLPEVLAFLGEAREYYRARLREARGRARD
jgi:hypothetical protein